MVANLGHHGHMTWYILNIPDNIPSQDVMVTFVWYILNILNMDWFGMVLVLHPRPYNILAMYQVSTSPLAPSGWRKHINELDLGTYPKSWIGRGLRVLVPGPPRSHDHATAQIFSYIFSPLAHMF